MLSEGKKAEWIAKNQGDKLHYVMKDRDETKWLKRSLKDVAEEFEKHGGRYAPYLVKLYFAGEIKLIEDLYRTQPLLQLFDKVKTKLKQRDITQYSLDELKQALEPYQDAISNKNIDPAKDKQFLENKTMTRLIKTPNFEIVVPHTQETSCLLGKGTDWCTAADDDHNMWHDYAHDGNLYVIRAGDKRFQLHYESDSFMDVDDNNVSKEDIAYLSKFPEWKKFLEALIKKHLYNEDNIIKTFKVQDQDYRDDEDQYDGDWD